MKYAIALLLLVVNLFAAVPDNNPVNCLPFDSNGNINYECVSIAPLPFTKYTILNGDFPNLYPYVSIQTIQTIDEDNTNNISYSIVFADNVDISFSTNPSHGIVQKSNNKIIYTPNTNYNGTDSFNIKFTDSIKGILEKTINITINAVNDIPEITMDSIIETNEGTSTTKTFIVFDAEGDIVTPSISTNPIYGTASILDNKVIYTPTVNYVGRDNFTISFNDNNGGITYKNIEVTVYNAKLLKKGWNLTSLPTSNELDIPGVSTIWHYDSSNKRWKIYSNTNQNEINTLDNIDTLDRTSTSKAYWVYATDDVNISFENSSIENFDYSILKDGWHMLGSYNGMSSLSSIQQDSKIAWMYNDNNCSVQALDKSLITVLSKFNFKQFTSIPPRAGFWILKKTNIPPSISLAITPLKEFYYLKENIALNAIVSDADNDNITLKWDHTSSTDSNITVSYSTAGNYNISATATDAKDGVSSVTKTLKVIDELKPSDMALFTHAKSYEYYNAGASIKLTITKKDANSFYMNEASSVYSSDIGQTLYFSINTIFDWNGKGFSGAFSKNNLTLFSGVVDGVNMQATYTKLKEYFYADCYNKTIQTKLYALLKLTASYPYNESVYFKVYNNVITKLDDVMEYNTLYNNFDNYFTNMRKINADGIPADIKENIFTDFGF